MLIKRKRTRQHGWKPQKENVQQWKWWATKEAAEKKSYLIWALRQQWQNKNYAISGSRSTFDFEPRMCTECLRHSHMENVIHTILSLINGGNHAKPRTILYTDDDGGIRTGKAQTSWTSWNEILVWLLCVGISLGIYLIASISFACGTLSIIHCGLNEQAAAKHQHSHTQRKYLCISQRLKTFRREVCWFQQMKVRLLISLIIFLRLSAL